MKTQEIKELLDKKHIKYEERSIYIRILSCDLGDNFYDYGDNPKPLVIDDEELQFLVNEPKVYIVDCEGCCGCAGW